MFTFMIMMFDIAEKRLMDCVENSIIVVSKIQKNFWTRCAASGKEEAVKTCVKKRKLEPTLLCEMGEGVENRGLFACVCVIER
jgi:hypothetical protein